MDKYEKLRQRYEQSGKTRRAFAKESGMSVSKLYNWLKKAENIKGEEGGFVGMDILPGGSSGTIRIRTSQGVTIEIPV
jgi:hypothetical protein